jgi:hypothetical protein
MPKRKRGLAGVASTKTSLKQQAKACGSYYFSPGTMRHFNSRLLSVHPAPAKDTTYFVESKGGDKYDPVYSTIPKHYTIGVFKSCEVHAIGKGPGGKRYKSAQAAKKVAAAIARKASRKR